MTEKFANLHGRIDELREDVKPLRSLPCGEMKEKIRGINGKIVWMWAMIVILIGSIVGVAMRVLAR